MATVIGFSAICASVMLDMRRGEESWRARRWKISHPASMPTSAATSRLYDLSLRAVASNMVMPELKDVSKTIRHLILFDHAATAKHFGAIQVFDAEGRLTIDASTLDPAPENRGDEEYFQVHRDKPDVGLFISRPMLHRGRYSIVLEPAHHRRRRQLSRRRRGLNPRFSYFHDLFDRLHLDRTTRSRCCAATARIIMRTPFDLDVIGKNLGRPAQA